MRNRTMGIPKILARGAVKKQRAPGRLITYIPRRSRGPWGVLSSLKEGASLFILFFLFRNSRGVEYDDPSIVNFVVSFWAKILFF